MHRYIQFAILSDAIHMAVNTDKMWFNAYMKYTQGHMTINWSSVEMNFKYHVTMSRFLRGYFVPKY